MPNDIDDAFVAQYEREVKEAYQLKGSMLARTVRRKPNVVGTTTTFQTVGKGVATTKARHGTITPMNVTHTPVTATMADWYAGDFVDKLDEAKINHDERRVLVNAGAYALGRKTDQLLAVVMNTTSNAIAHGSTAFTFSKIMSALEDLGDFDVFEGGRMYCVVGWNAWTDLLQISQFADADFVGGDGLVFPDGVEAKRWLGTVWMPSTAVDTEKSGSTFLSFWYHEDSVGLGINASIVSDITWQGTRQSHWVVNRMSQGAALIDGNGCIEIGHQ